MQSHVIKKQKLQRIVHIFELQKKVMESQLAVLLQEKAKENKLLGVLGDQSRIINEYRENSDINVVLLEQKKLYAELLTRGMKQQSVKTENIVKKIGEYQQEWLSLKFKIERIDEKIHQIRQYLI